MDSQAGRHGFDPALPLHVFKSWFAQRLISRYANGVTANAVFPEPYDSAGHPQFGKPTAKADTFSPCEYHCRKRSQRGRQEWRPGRNRAADRKLGKSTLLGAAGAFRAWNRPKKLCLFLAYFVHQQPAAPDSPKQHQAARKFLAERRLGSNQQVAARAGKLG